MGKKEKPRKKIGCLGIVGIIIGAIIVLGIIIAIISGGKGDGTADINTATASDNPPKEFWL